jgi:hypothetical protein
MGQFAGVIPAWPAKSAGQPSRLLPQAASKRLQPPGRLAGPELTKGRPGVLNDHHLQLRGKDVPDVEAALNESERKIGVNKLAGLALGDLDKDVAH